MHIPICSGLGGQISASRAFLLSGTWRDRYVYFLLFCGLCVYAIVKQAFQGRMKGVVEVEGILGRFDPDLRKGELGVGG